MKNGGSIDDQQDDLATPVHLAASQGSLELLQLMFTSQPSLKNKVIQMTDIQGMTALHKYSSVLLYSLVPLGIFIFRAAMGDHVDVIAYLLEVVSFSLPSSFLSTRIRPLGRRHRCTRHFEKNTAPSCCTQVIGSSCLLPSLTQCCSHLS